MYSRQWDRKPEGQLAAEGMAIAGELMLVFPRISLSIKIRILLSEFMQ